MSRNSNIRGSLSRDAFIADHALTCQAVQCRKYDNDKKSGQLHSLEYSRRKCAKNIWRKLQRETVRP